MCVPEGRLFHGPSTTRTGRISSARERIFARVSLVAVDDPAFRRLRIARDDAAGSPHGRPPAAGISLQASMLSSSGQEDSVPSIELDTPPEDGYFEDDEPVLYAEESDCACERRRCPFARVDAVRRACRGDERSTSGPDCRTAVSAELRAASLLRLPSPAKPHRPNACRAARPGPACSGSWEKDISSSYVFDRSGSMDGHGGAPLVAAKSELLSSLGDLGQTHQFQIIFYNEQPRIFSPGGDVGRLVFGNDQNKNLRAGS